MKASPVILHTRRRAAIRFGLRAFAAAYRQHIAPVIAAAIEASKPLPRFKGGGISSVSQQGEEFIISGRGVAYPLAGVGGQPTQQAHVFPEINMAQLRSSLDELAERARRK